MTDRTFPIVSSVRWAALLWLLVVEFGRIVVSQEASQEPPVNVTFCDLYKDPARYSGKMVSLRARVRPYGGYGNRIVSEPSFTREEQCFDGYLTIGLEYPSEIKPKPEFDLVKDSAYQEYEDASRRGMAIDATVQGLFEASFVWREKQKIRVGPGDGFGKKKWQEGRLVLRSISNVIAKPVSRK